MSNPSRLEGDYYFAGSVTFASLAAPNSSWGNDNIAAAAGIAASKLQHQNEIAVGLTKHTEDAATLRRVIHIPYGATATVLSFHAGATVAAGAGCSITVQLKKNGSSILTSAITVDDGDAAFALVAAAGFTSTALVAGDVLEAEIASVTGATPPKGVFVRLVLRSDAD